MPKLPIMTKRTSEETKISGKAKSLVDTLVATGCTITEASKLAGYKGNSARVSASRMLRKPEVQAYMMQEINRSLGLNSAKASAKLVALSQVLHEHRKVFCFTFINDHNDLLSYFKLYYYSFVL